MHAPKRRFQVGDDLLTADDENYLASRIGVRTKLTGCRRRGDQNTVLGDGIEAAQHEIRGGDDPANLVRLGLAIHLEVVMAQGIVLVRIEDRLQDTGVLKGFRFAGMNLRPFGYALQH